ncbi:NADPH:quinone reductase-like Zn-dependent oxidoreductase [Kitasatospora sp. GAS204A]|uniref:NADP-dependent oxidoreductase n=1 Tax=unclassified Kitasatospora TaxID=2633591 RepID=UPI00247BB3DD|nr:NADPH:quinone reductase-like Zn-dependent oxidoreductase [Kitasatospora sp. GAS204B]
MPFRAHVFVAAGALAVAAILLLITGSRLRHSYDSTLAGCRTSGGACGSALSALTSQYDVQYYVVSGLVVAVPGLLGAFWGAPLIARELEAGTHRLSWNQSITRTRWLAVKLLFVGLVAVATSGLLSLLVSWWASPIGARWIELPGIAGGPSLLQPEKRVRRTREHSMPKAVRFNEYGEIDVLQVVEVPRPVPGEGEVLVQVKAAGINPGEAMIRRGALHDRWPATFPSGEGSDLAGVVAEVGPGAEGFAVGDEVIGFTYRRGSHAEFAIVEAKDLTPRPANVPWAVGGSLFVAGSTAYAAVRAVELKPGDTVAVSGAAGGVGSLVVQLAKRAGVEVIGIAGPGNHDWLRAHGITPVAYGDGLDERLREAAGGRIDAFVDTYGGGYVKLAVELGVDPTRINTIIDFAAVEEYGVKADGSAMADTVDVLAELVALIADGALEVPIAAEFPLTEVRAAFEELERRHTRGKIVLVP